MTQLRADDEQRLPASPQTVDKLPDLVSGHVARQQRYDCERVEEVLEKRQMDFDGMLEVMGLADDVDKIKPADLSEGCRVDGDFSKRGGERGFLGRARPATGVRWAGPMRTTLRIFVDADSSSA